MALALMIASPNVAIGNADEVNAFGWVTDTATEANAQYRATEGATFSLLRVNIISGNSGTATIKFRDGGADGSQSLSGSGTGVLEDAVNTDTLTAGDDFNIAYTDTGTNSTLSWLAMNVEFASGYGCFHGSANFLGTVCDVASSTRYIGFSGLLGGDGEATEAITAWRVRGYTSMEAMQVRVSANARTNDSTFKNRINGSDGTAVITFGSGITGLIVDDALGDAITDGHTLNASITLDTGVEDLTVTFVGATLKSSDTEQDVWLHRSLTRAASATENYLPIGGYSAGLTAFTETQARCKIGYAGTAKNLRCYLSANTYGADATLKLIKNGTAVITVTLTASGGAGWYENTSDTVTFTATDEFSYEFDEGTSGSATIQMVGMTLVPDVGSAATSTFAASIGASSAGAGAKAASLGINALYGSLGAVTGSKAAQAGISAVAGLLGALESTQPGSSDFNAIVGALVSVTHATARISTIEARIGARADIAGMRQAVSTLQAIAGAIGSIVGPPSDDRTSTFAAIAGTSAQLSIATARIASIAASSGALGADGAASIRSAQIAALAGLKTAIAGINGLDVEKLLYCAVDDVALYQCAVMDQALYHCTLSEAILH